MKRLAAIFAILAIMGLAVWWMSRGDTSGSNGAFLGYVEGELLYIGPNEGERLASLAVEAGVVVAKGDRLFVMATTLLDRQRAEAAARIGQMEAQVENLQASMNRPEQIAVLEAEVERAQASLNLSRNDYQRQKTLFSGGHVAKAALDRAAMALSRDEATLKEAKRKVDVARMASRSHEIDAGEASLQQARAQRDALDIRITRQAVLAPAPGVVQDIFFRPGEMVNAGQPVLSLLPPENRKVRFYVAEPQLAKVRLGARVKVNCDGCADDLFGRISFVASRQEFTPPVIFSDEERAKLVFKAEARLEGRARELPLGLPVSIRPWPDDAQGAMRR
jgi:HlyD family secretion protein